jgi:rhodanese-related sulfurtransferase
MEPTRLTPEQVRAKLDAGRPVTFVDTRSPQQWDASDAKLPGALHVPAAEIEQHLDAIPRDATIVTYCA